MSTGLLFIRKNRTDTIDTIVWRWYIHRQDDVNR